ncbi:ribose 1,5-bisphosphate phosphokinase PhnN [Tateyamaria omphalii]|uniref:phosphonate metabolism protein/1,5-bisphosphokinase (PRPP-forming) PhnN n=1 Tax=Tateyamaria omphalii TaxID=299262 RepID=UPI001674826D|nr:phosphonate metabolism protein/1,5-bisphosphokinase (PRPP-forming) PhnN [Tateyamaria omphalii]GGX43143.1 ribose 1,5-bisphosphate phosphokinase PhnN [Tateyamaria omphalii]
MTGRLIAIVGPSGVGKDTVMEALASAEPRLELVRRVITRPTGAGGEQFDGQTVPAFQAMEQAGAFALSWTAHGLHYGIPASVDTTLACGKDVLANLSRGVLSRAQKRFPGMTVIALTAAPDVLANRLAARGREKSEDISQRLARADLPMPPGVNPTIIDNSGALAKTVRTALDVLYPVKA